MIILGISCLYHDSAAALVVDGKIVAAVQEERFSRIKFDASFPVNSIKYCMKEGGIAENDIDYVVYYDNPALTLNRFLCNAVACGNNRYDAVASGYKDVFERRLWIEQLLKLEFPRMFENTRSQLLVSKHHISHAASAFFPSPFRKSIILTIDGVGEWTTTSIGVGFGNHIQLMEEIRYPHSLGLFYSSMAYFCGFKVNSEEYKFMGLASYGHPRYRELLKEEIIDIKEDGSFRLNLKYFDFQNGRTMINEQEFTCLFGRERRKNNELITRQDMDIAASAQKIVEEVVIKLSQYAKKTYGKDIGNLCLAGGVALNCVANGELIRQKIYDNIWIQPAAGDAGGALGAALYVYYDYLDNKRNTDEVHDMQEGSFLGPAYSHNDIVKFLNSKGYVFYSSENIALEVAKFLSKGKVVGFFSGRLEYGPRALGHRSILADPRSEIMQSKLNLKIKHRESFRPFAPAVLKEDRMEYFEIVKDSPYMLVCAYVNKRRRLPFDLDKSLKNDQGDMLPVVNQVRSDIPAVTHVDYSARIQTVDKTNRELYDILSEFKKLTGYGVIINTSFNSSEEPIVCTPEDAVICFMKTDMDILVLEDIILTKKDQMS